VREGEPDEHGAADEQHLHGGGVQGEGGAQ
jgi:hypothetical protein